MTRLEAVSTAFCDFLNTMSNIRGFFRGFDVLDRHLEQFFSCVACYLAVRVVYFEDVTCCIADPEPVEGCL